MLEVNRGASELARKPIWHRRTKIQRGLPCGGREQEEIAVPLYFDLGFCRQSSHRPNRINPGTFPNHAIQRTGIFLMANFMEVWKLAHICATRLTRDFQHGVSTIGAGTVMILSKAELEYRVAEDWLI